MRTTIDLPDELFRRAKVEAATRGRTFKDLVEEGLRRILADSDAPKEKEKTPTLFGLMSKACGVTGSGVKDLASNPKHMKDFGRD